MNTSRFELLRFEVAQALADSVVEQWCSQLAKRRDETGVLTVALPGGRIARTFFETFARRVESDPPGGLSRLEFFWGDERCVAPGHEDSNYRLARETFLERLNISAGRVHRIEGELDPDAAALRASEELRRVAVLEAGVPVLDWVFLGMGEDGHVASLFPEEPTGGEGFEGSDSVYRAVVASKPPPRRVTLGYRVIEAAREVWVLASGEGKRAALDLSLGTAGMTPLHRVIQSRARTRIFTDIR